MGERTTSRRTAVPILLYHAVTETPGSHIAPFTVSPDTFARQLDVLVEAGYRCVTFGELMAAEAAGRLPGPDGKVAVLTFDDGFADFATAALPALRERSLVSTLYLTTGWLDGVRDRHPGPSDPMLSLTELPDLLHQGVELGAHSHSHPEMDTLGDAALREELVRPKEILEDVLGHPVTTFAYPHGYNGPRVRRATRAAGYDNACGVRNALHCAGEDTFGISRLMLRSTTTLDELTGWLEAVECAPLVREAWQTRGWRAYRRSRALITGRPGSAYR